MPRRLTDPSGPSPAATRIPLTREIAALRSQLRQKAKQLAFFIQTGKALTSTLELDKVLDVIMERARRLIPCQRWSLLLVEEINGRRELRPHRPKTGPQGASRRIAWGKGPPGWAAQHARPLLIEDRASPLPAGLRDWKPPRSGFRSLLAIPIVNKRKTLGVLEMVNRADGHPFDESDRDLMAQLMAQAAIAIERSQLYRRMAELTITDDLTKLFNFRHLDQTLDIEIRRCLRYGSVLSLIFLDLDYFKTVNDRYGHLMGSRVLVEVAELLIRNLRDVDIISRYGGDEFVVVLPETGLRTTQAITKRLHRSFQRHEFLAAEGIGIRLTASFGIAGFPDHAKNKKDLIRLADQAMYEAKYGGRDRVCIAQRRLPKTDAAPGHPIRTADRRSRKSGDSVRRV
ncbi:MAG: sensor domain-containing diguanylate cyclase [Nitrospiria bacterium]